VWFIRPRRPWQPGASQLHPHPQPPVPRPAAKAVIPEAVTPPLVLSAVVGRAKAARTPAAKAEAWAVAELLSPDPSWSDEIGAPWSGYCEAFVEIAYGTRYQFASARLDYLAQKGAGRIHADSNPPAGALVYYGGGNDGHVALSVADGEIITTWGFAGQRFPVRETGLLSVSNPYYGWALPPVDWPGGH
jgi:hypothetical protein